MIAESRGKGGHTREEWRELLAACGGRCAKCGTTKNVTKDHIVPISAGGSDSIENLQPLCGTCNNSKGGVRRNQTSRGGARTQKAASVDGRVTIRLPELWAFIREFNGASRVSVEHAALDCRAAEVAATLALSIPGDVLLVAVPAERARNALAIATDGLRCKKRGGKEYSMLQLGRSRVWLCARPEVGVAELPVASLAGVIVAGAHRLAQDPVLRIASLVRGPIICIGQFAEREHWSYRRARDPGTKLYRIDAAHIVRAYPDQTPSIIPDTDQRAARLMYLRDEEIRPPPFTVIARKRLWIRTDKHPSELTAGQLREANAMLGAGWHSRGMSAVVPLHVRPLQRKYIAIKRAAAKQGKKHVLLLKYRRGGFTTLEQAQSYVRAVTCPRSYVATLAHTDDATQRIFRMVHTFHELDPDAPPTVGEPSKTKIEFANGSLFFIGTAGGRGFARGDTLQRYHGSEVSRWRIGPNQFRDVEDLAASLRGAAMHGEGVFETTPNGVDWFCVTYRDAKLGLNDYFPAFLRWHDDPMNRKPEGTYNAQEVVETLTEDENALINAHDLDLAQIAFRREQKLIHRRLFPAEWPEDDEACFLSSGYSFFDPDVVTDLLRRLRSEDQPPSKHLPGGHEIVWAEPEAGVEYVIGVDTSEGIAGGDPCGAGVLRRDTGEQVASVHGIFKPHALAEICVELSKRYNRALLGIERQNHGHAVLEAVTALGYGRSHLTGGQLYHYADSRAGWSTDTGTRPIMLDELARAIEDRAMKIHDLVLLSECLTFRLQTGGKWEADRGAHDDAVMKWAIAWQMRKYRRAKPGLAVLEGTL